MAKITEETKSEVRDFNKDLSGSLNSRCKKIRFKFKISKCSIIKIIRAGSDVKVVLPITDKERVNILKYYKSIAGEVMSKGINQTALKFKRSTDSIRRIVKENKSSKDKLFDYKKFPF